MAAVARGLSVTQCYCDTLDLELDATKTFLWTNNAKLKPGLGILGFPVVDEARELGGVMAYHGRTRNKRMKDRCDALDPLWQKLRRSKAPLPLKLRALHTKLWPQALHGISGCPLPESQMQKLRASATAALSIRPGGVSSLLRLSLESKLECDPGFFQLWSCLRDVRRMALKLPVFLLDWRQYMLHLDGRVHHGPLSKLVVVLNQVGWTVGTPPWVCDHEGLWHDVLQCPGGLLRRLLSHAWLAYVARQLQHRRTMCDLRGIDSALLQADSSRLSRQDASRLAAVRGGAFITGAQQCKFEKTQDGLCSVCRVPDTVEHKICHCLMHQHLRGKDAWVCAHWTSLPLSFSHHLLPPANPFLPELRRQLHALDDSVGQFHCAPSAHAIQHLFTDGACSHASLPDLALAAWGVIHAGHEKPVAAGVVPGLQQTAPRAELCAVIAAARWAWTYVVQCHVWVDALHVVDGVSRLHAGGDAASWENAGLWVRLGVLLEALPPESFRVHHTPSHLDSLRTESPFEDWLAQHNGHADTLAVAANTNRSVSFQEQHKKAFDHHTYMLEAGRALRNILFRIHDATTGGTAATLDPDDDEGASKAPELAMEARASSIEDTLVVSWRTQIRQAGVTLPLEFLEGICSFIFEQDVQSSHLYNTSWLELVFMLHFGAGPPYPSPGPGGSWTAASAVVYPQLPPTIAGRMRIKRTVREAFRALGLLHTLVVGLDSRCWG